MILTLVVTTLVTLGVTLLTIPEAGVEAAGLVSILRLRTVSVIIIITHGHNMRSDKQDIK